MLQEQNTESSSIRAPTPRLPALSLSYTVQDALGNIYIEGGNPLALRAGSIMHPEFLSNQWYLHHQRGYR